MCLLKNRSTGRPRFIRKHIKSLQYGMRFSLSTQYSQINSSICDYVNLMYFDCRAFIWKFLLFKHLKQICKTMTHQFYHEIFKLGYKYYSNLHTSIAVTPESLLWLWTSYHTYSLFPSPFMVGLVEGMGWWSILDPSSPTQYGISTSVLLFNNVNNRVFPKIDHTHLCKCINGGESGLHW